jgi:hypothetical protein
MDNRKRSLEQVARVADDMEKWADLDWRAPKGKVNVQVLGSWIFVAVCVVLLLAVGIGAILVIGRVFR